MTSAESLPTAIDRILKRAALLAVTLLGAGFATGYAVAQQVHLKAALEALTSAESHLKLHKPDTGGHAAKALEAIATAKKHVEAGMTAK